jgi:hypothetical protein
MTADGPAPEVVEFGAGDRQPTRRARFAGLPAGLIRASSTDRRTVPVVAGLAALAALASVVGEWRVVTLPTDGQNVQTTLRISEGVFDIGAAGVIYLVGLLALTCLLALQLAGAPAVRHAARVIGLALGGAVLVLLTAATAALHDMTGTLYSLVSNDRQTVELGRGITFAFVTVVLALVAQLVAGRFLPAARPAAGSTGPDGPADEPPSGWAGEWGWRRRRLDRDETEEDLAEATPLDLTVEPASPFARPTQD